MIASGYDFNPAPDREGFLRLEITVDFPEYQYKKSPALSQLSIRNRVLRQLDNWEKAEEKGWKKNGKKLEPRKGAR